LFAGSGTRTRTETLAESLQGQRVGPADPAPVQRVGGELEEDLAGEGVVVRMQRSKLGQHLEDVCIAAESVEQDSAGGGRVFGGGSLGGRHTPTVEQAC
jgi:hypothetical protein